MSNKVSESNKVPNTVLFFLTSHEDLGSSGKKTGFHYEEMTTPYYQLKDAGFDVVFASLAGGQPPHDPNSVKEPMIENPETVQRFLQDKEAMNELKHSRTINELKNTTLDHFSAIYFPGGHGAMWDLPEDEQLAALVSQFFQSGKPVAAVCHGIAGLVGAKDQNGESIFKNKHVNCFSNAEEKAIDLDKVVPFLLESRVTDLGGQYQCAELFEAYVAVDNNLITGQNPKSAAGVGEKLVQQLRGVFRNSKNT